jgi:hypothetical protein
METINVRATRGSIEDFKKSILWADMIRELNAWKKGFEMEMKGIVEDAASENPSTASVLLHLGDINGRIKAVDYMLSLPDVFLSLLEEKKDESRPE